MNIIREKMGRALVWSDEFEGSKLNPEKWGFQQSMYTKNREYYNGGECVRTENSMLHMQVHKSQKEGLDYKLPQGVVTDKTMLFKYGYLEIRACLPFRHGAWPSFWLKSNTPFQKADWMCETDVFEVFSDKSKAVCNLHKWGGGKHCMLPGGEGSIDRAYTFENYENLNSEFHTYGFEWDKDEMNFYVDDVKYSTFPISSEKANFGSDVIDGIEGFHDFQYILFNNEIFTASSNWLPEGTALTEEDRMPIDYYIDYVRLYQKQGEEIKLKAEIEEALKK